jgi:predicted nucleic acid-binding protein
MTVRAFVDTNVLVCAASSAPQDREKKRRAAELIAAIEFGISAQVLAEFYVTVTRKGDPPMQAGQALEWIEALERQPCASVDAAVVKRGVALSQRYRISYWDGAILAAAETLGAEVLYSEDLQHGQIYGSVRVENPFRAA